MPRLISGVWPVFRLDAGSSASLLCTLYTLLNIGIPVPHVSSFHVIVSLFSWLCLFHKKTKRFNLHIFTDDNLLRLPFSHFKNYKKLFIQKILGFDSHNDGTVHRNVRSLYNCSCVPVGSRKLYGGDLESAVAVMRTVASRIQFLLQQGPARFYKKEAYIQVHKSSFFALRFGKRRWTENVYFCWKKSWTFGTSIRFPNTDPEGHWRRIPYGSVSETLVRSTVPYDRVTRPRDPTMCVVLNIEYSKESTRGRKKTYFALLQNNSAHSQKVFGLFVSRSYAFY